MSRLLVVGSSNGSTNLGDESMWAACAQSLRAHDPRVEIVTDAWPGWTPPVERVEVLPFLHPWLLRWPGTPRSRVEAAARLVVNRDPLPRALARATAYGAGAAPRTAVEARWDSAIRDCDGVVFAGAGGITDQHALHGVAAWQAIALRARHHGRPVAFVGHGVGPLREPATRAAAATMLATADLVTTRDDASAELTRALAPGTDVRSTADWALLLRPTERERREAREQRVTWFGSAEYVVLSLHADATAGTARTERVVAAMAGLAERVVATGRWVVLVPNMTLLRRTDDRVVLRAVRDRVAPRERRCVRLLEDTRSAGFVKALLGGARLTVSSRYHPVVFSLSAGTPAVGLAFNDYYVQKLSGALRWYAPGTPVPPVDEAAAVDLSAADDDALRSALLRRTDELAGGVEGPLHAWLGRRTGPHRTAARS